MYHLDGSTTSHVTYGKLILEMRKPRLREGKPPI